MGALDKLITRNLGKFEDLLTHSLRPVGLEDQEMARRLIAEGIDPVVAQARAKKLSLEPEDIEARARAMGFDKKAYHGTEAVPEGYDSGYYERKGSIILPFGQDFDELIPRQVEGDLRLGPSTISTYLGPHVARDPQMSYGFSGFRPDRLADLFGTTGKSVSEMPRDEINDLVRSLSGPEREKFWSSLDYELGRSKYGRVLPLRLRGDVRDLPQEYTAGWDKGKRIHDDRAVDIDVATHALATDPTWLQEDSWHAVEDQSMEFKTIEDMLTRALGRGNPEDEVRKLVQLYYEDLKPLKLSGDDPQVLERMLDDYRTDYSRTGRPLLRYQNTVEDEYAYSPSEDAYIVLDPTAVRSESAIFDPDLRHLSGLGYAGGGQVGKLAKIVAAALRSDSGEMFQGTSHYNALQGFLDKYGEKNIPLEDGFLTEAGEFLTRSEGLNRARATGQVYAPDDWSEEANQLQDRLSGYAGGGQVGKLARIVAAALKADSGEIFKGGSHADAWELMTSKLPYYNEKGLATGKIDITDGFLDEDGKFLTRGEAARRMDELGDVGRGDLLRSEIPPTADSVLPTTWTKYKNGVLKDWPAWRVGNSLFDTKEEAEAALAKKSGYAGGGKVAKTLMAAVRDVLTGNVYKGPTHAHAIYDMALDKYGDVEANDIMSLIDNYADDAEDGFITPRGRFMSREQATKYMRSELGDRLPTDPQGELFSEDLGIDVEKHQDELAKLLDPDYYEDEGEASIIGGLLKDTE